MEHTRRLLEKGRTRLRVPIAKGVQQGSIPVATFLDHPALGRIIDIDDAKRFGIAINREALEMTRVVLPTEFIARQSCQPLAL